MLITYMEIWAALFVQIGKAVVVERLYRDGSGSSCDVFSDDGPRQLACVFGFCGPPGFGSRGLGRPARGTYPTMINCFVLLGLWDKIR